MRELTLEEMDCVSGGDDWTEEVTAYCNSGVCTITYTRPFDTYTITSSITLAGTSVTSIAGGFSSGGQSYNFQINPQNGNMSGTYTQQFSNGWSGTFNVYNNGSGGTGIGVTLSRTF
jgi:hypothetical protein